VAGDIGFLAMDLDFRGRPDLADVLVQRYARAAADPEILDVIAFYKCYRACVRGKVDSFRLAQAEVGADEKERARSAAHRYFRLACRYAAEQPPPLLLITCGLVATGKSVLAQGLGEAAGMPVISSDVVRKELAGLAPRERRLEPFGRGIYSARFSVRTYKALLERARQALTEGRSVIVDATFAERRYRRRARDLAQAMGARFLCLECRADEGVIRERLEERLQAGRDASDARWEIYEAQKRVFEPPTEFPPDEHLAADCSQSPARCLAEARRELERRLAPPSA
jgi:predicted kinase